MKKLTLLIGALLLSGLFIMLPGSWAFDGGRGGHMMGRWGYDGYERGNRGFDSTLTREEQEQLNTLDCRYYEETRELRNQLWSKTAELDTALMQTTPDTDTVIRLQKEVSDLRSRLEEKEITYELEARKIAPNKRFGAGYGYGRHMRGRFGARGYGMGYGPGSCWNY